MAVQAGEFRSSRELGQSDLLRVTLVFFFLPGDICPSGSDMNYPIVVFGIHARHCTVVLACPGKTGRFEHRGNAHGYPGAGGSEQ